MNPPPARHANAFWRRPACPRVGLRERWRSGRPEFVVLAGSAIGLVGNVALVVPTLASGGDTGTLAAIGFAILFCTLTPLALRGARPRSAVRFTLSAMAATAVVLLTPPGIVGGGIALGGALWGFLAAEAQTPGG